MGKKVIKSILRCFCLEKNIFSDIVIKEIRSVNTHICIAPKGITKNRNAWSIVLKYEGEATYYCNGKEYISNAENVIVLPKGSSFTWNCIKQGVAIFINFECDSESDNIFSFNVGKDDKILKMFKDIDFKFTIKKDMYKVECIRDCYSLLLSLYKVSNLKYIPGKKQQKLVPAIEYIAKNYSKNITNDILASICKMSTVYFRKMFKEVYCISPIAYIHKIRIDKAKDMLRADYGSLTDIAISLGYGNIYEFSRDFKKHTGVSPSKY